MLSRRVSSEIGNNSHQFSILILILILMAYALQCDSANSSCNANKVLQILHISVSIYSQFSSHFFIVSVLIMVYFYFVRVKSTLIPNRLKQIVSSVFNRITISLYCWLHTSIDFRLLHKMLIVQAWTESTLKDEFCVKSRSIIFDYRLNDIEHSGWMLHCHFV